MINDESNTLSNQTLSECLNDALKDGYTENFRVMGMGLWLTSEDEQFTYNPDDVTIPNFYQLSACAIPQHSAIVYLIETEDGKKGTLINAFSAHDDSKLFNFIKQVDDLHPKPKVAF